MLNLLLCHGLEPTNMLSMSRQGQGSSAKAGSLEKLEASYLSTFVKQSK